MKHLLTLALLAGNAAFAAAQAPRQKEPADEPEVKLPTLLSAKPLEAGPKDDELVKLLKARYNEALAEAREHYKRFATGAIQVGALGPSGDMMDAGQRVVGAFFELNERPADRVAILTQYVALLREAEKVVQESHDAGRMTALELHRVRYHRLDAEIRLLRAKREAGKGK